MASRTISGRRFLDPYEDFDANIDADFESEVVNEESNFLSGLAMKCFSCEDQILWER